jgi:PIN domain nuclease of toxin-antitoxin system
MPSSATQRPTAEQPRARTTIPQRSPDSTASEAQLPTLIDASALIALLGGEPAAGEVREILQAGAAITALNLTEAVDRLGRRYGLAIERVRPVIEGLLEESLQVMSVNSAQAWRAAGIRIANYHRTSCPVSLADVVLIASAAPGQRIATSDSHILRIAAREDIEVIPLPDSHGRRPS